MSEKNYSQQSILTTPNEVPPAILAVESEIGRKSFFEFTKMCFHVVVPNTKFSESWHIKLLCDCAQACFEGKIYNLMVNIPPRHSKSLLFLVFFPAWVWANDPSKKFLCASFAKELAEDFSVQCRELITSEFYQERWPLQLAKDSNAKDSFKNIFGGYRKSFGTNSAVTGYQGHFLIGDDLLRVQDAYSDTIREGINSWFGGTFSNRKADPKKTVRILLGQRIHPSDCFGDLLEKDKNNRWERVVLPAKYEGERYQSSIGLNDPRTENGEVLWPDVYGEAELDALTENMSQIEIQGQMQQNPFGFGGTVFKKEWFSIRANNNNSVVARYQSWDTAASITNSSAYSSCVTGEIDGDYKLHIIDVFRDRVDFPDLQEIAENLATRWRWNLKKIIIESKSTGIPLIYSLKKSSIKWIGELIYPYNPGMSKEARWSQAALWCSMDGGGLVNFPFPSESNIWLGDFESEIFTVPQSKYLDQADSFSQLVLYCQGYLEQANKARRSGRNGGLI